MERRKAARAGRGTREEVLGGASTLICISKYRNPKTYFDEMKGLKTLILLWNFYEQGPKKRLFRRDLGSIPRLDVAARGVLDRLHLAAAGLSRRHFGGILVLEPLRPIGPPRAGALISLGDPALEIAERRSVAPIEIFHRVGRIDDAGDVAGAGQHELDRTAEEF